MKQNIYSATFCNKYFVCWRVRKNESLENVHHILKDLHVDHSSYGLFKHLHWTVIVNN